jgi:hypothetical protein
LEFKKNATFNRAVHNDIISRLQNNQVVQKEVIKSLKNDLAERIPDQTDRKKCIGNYMARQCNIVVGGIHTRTGASWSHDEQDELSEKIDGENSAKTSSSKEDAIAIN